MSLRATGHFFQLVQVMLVSLGTDVFPIDVGSACVSRGCCSCGICLARVRVMGSLGLVGYSVQWVEAVVEQPASRTLTC